jgi:gluconolactonase
MEAALKEGQKRFQTGPMRQDPATLSGIALQPRIDLSLPAARVFHGGAPTGPKLSPTSPCMRLAHARSTVRQLAPASVHMFTLVAALTLAGAAVHGVSTETPPRILTHPASRLLAEGGTVVLRITATGTAPLSYQWYANDMPRPGATNAVLTFAVQPDLVGAYLVVVSNAHGSVTSRVARVETFVNSGIFDIADAEEFDKVLSTNSVLTRHATLNSWIEGVVWIPSGEYLVFSDIGANKLKKLIPPSDLSDFLVPPANTRFNGNLLDLNERLISCRAGRAALDVVMTTNGVSVPLLTQYTNSAKFYSPNDLAIASDGSIWFTDPGYDSGLPLPPPVGTSIPPGFQPGLYVYRFFQTNGNTTVTTVVTNMTRPNGICLSPDETRLYVADSGITPGVIRVYDIHEDGTVTGGEILRTMASGVPDGIKCDVDGRIWSSAEEGVYVIAADGHLVGRIRLTRTANLCFGGPDYKTLFTVGQPYVSSIPVKVAGAVALKRLRASVSEDEVRVTWPAPSTGFSLQTTEALSGNAAWTDEAESVTEGDSKVIRVPLTNSSRFFRLQLR